MNEKKLFEEISIIKKLLGVIAIKDKGLKDQVKLLSEAGLQPSEIAGITGKSANLISVTKNSLKRK